MTNNSVGCSDFMASDSANDSDFAGYSDFAGQ